MRKINFVLLFLLVTISLVACGSEKKVDETSTENINVRIGVLRSAQPLNLSNEDGPLYERLYNVGASVKKVEGFAAMSPAVEALNADEIDITVGSITAGISALVGGTSEFTIFAKQQSAYENQGIVAKPNAGIKTPADLKGKKIAVNRGGTGEYLLYKALEAGNLTADDVKIVYLPPTEAGPAFEGNQVDAWATWGSFTAIAEVEYNAELVISAKDIDSVNDTIYVVRNAFLEAHPDIVSEIFEGFREEIELYSKNTEETVQLIVERQGVSEAVARKQLVEATTPLEPITEEVYKGWQETADYVFEKRIIPNKVSLKDSVVDITK
ncbi:aliphatic sulfonate ABC transporter substrate-binding protein [Peribacillus frigoritolerans]|uniref:aliphatic sulfonate ABC transporter substrate-binding protein n=1 Tax=Peribacillus frigoritolerans TaxID=450367 RepID=UPI0037FB8D0F